MGSGGGAPSGGPVCRASGGGQGAKPPSEADEVFVFKSAIFNASAAVFHQMMYCLSCIFCAHVESDVDRVQLFRLTLRFFRQRFDGVFIFFDSDLQIFQRRVGVFSHFLRVVFFSSKFMSVFPQVRFL